MRIGGSTFTAIDWDRLPVTETRGETGTAAAQVAVFDDVRVRHVRYSPGFRADHWCTKGHVLLVLEGSLVVEFQNDGSVELEAGEGCHLADDGLPHRGTTVNGAVVFIVD
jgi:hypothetical protein